MCALFVDRVDPNAQKVDLDTQRAAGSTCNWIAIHQGEVSPYIIE